MSNRSSGFLESCEHPKLDRKDSHRLLYERSDWKNQTTPASSSEPVVVRLTAEDQNKVTAKEIAELAVYSDSAARKAFQKESKIVTAAEPGTLRVRAAIAGVDA
jgi:hypothetical protein